MRARDAKRKRARGLCRGVRATRGRRAGVARASRARGIRDTSARRVDLAFWIFLVKLRYFAYSGCIRGNRARVAPPRIARGDILSWRPGARLTTNALAMSRRGVDGGGT